MTKEARTVEVRHHAIRYPAVVSDFQTVIASPDKCKQCSGHIVWGVTKKGKRIPLQPIGSWEIAVWDRSAEFVCHWGKCPSSSF